MEPSDFITLDDHDNFDFWKNYNYEINFFASLTTGLKLGESWSEEIILYGDSESACIRLFKYGLHDCKSWKSYC